MGLTRVSDLIGRNDPVLRIEFLDVDKLWLADRHGGIAEHAAVIGKAAAAGGIYAATLHGGFDVTFLEDATH